MAEKSPQRAQDESTDRVRLQIPSDPRYVFWVRKAIYDLAVFYGFGRQAAYDLKLIAGEALSNIILHAYQGATHKPIFIEAIMFPAYIEIRFRDLGIQRPITKNHSQDLSDYRESGLGVYLISKLSDYHFYDQSADIGTTLVIKKRLQK